jgi:hypothetical protein
MQEILKEGAGTISAKNPYTVMGKIYEIFWEYECLYTPYKTIPWKKNFSKIRGCRCPLGPSPKSALDFIS